MIEHPTRAKLLTISKGVETPLAAILMKPRKAYACFVFAHGAGAGMSHAFMEKISTGLYDRGIATLRFHFPFMEKGRRRPDSPTRRSCRSASRGNGSPKAVQRVTHHCGGKSFGGRMTSQAQAIVPLGVDGLAFIGFPLHPSGKPSQTRAEHLGNVNIPMLFIQGTRDKLAELSLLRPVVRRLRKRATLHLVGQADHGFRVPVRSGRTDLDVVREIIDAFADWSSKKLVR